MNEYNLQGAVYADTVWKSYTGNQERGEITIGWMQAQSNKEFDEQLKQVFSNASPEQIIPSIDEFRLLMTYY